VSWILHWKCVGLSENRNENQAIEVTEILHSDPGTQVHPYSVQLEAIG
jgi:hypothetical protein